MERIQALIDKLYQQRMQQAHPAQMLLTVQLLHSELIQLQQRNGSLGTSKVAVTLPVNMNFSGTSQPEPVEEAAAEPVAVVAVAPPVAKEPVVEVPAPAPREYRQPKPPAPEPIEEAHASYLPSNGVWNPALQTGAEAPTIAQHGRKKEVNEAIASTKESLNDRLKQEKTEVVHVLKDSPIRDLRKGIGINDRFTFVSELFRGDEAMYERSIKTINSFHILSEAEYWINRELKFKLGWNDTKETVQHFYHLVRRRFS